MAIGLEGGKGGSGSRLGAGTLMAVAEAGMRLGKMGSPGGRMPRDWSYRGGSSAIALGPNALAPRSPTWFLISL